MATLSADVAFLLNNAASLRRRGHIKQALNSVRLARSFRLGCTPKAAAEQLRGIVSRNAAFVGSLFVSAIEMVKVDVWADGYASDRGPTTITIPANANPQTEAYLLVGPMAKVFSVRKSHHVAPVTSKAAMAYTLRDNT